MDIVYLGTGNWNSLLFARSQALAGQLARSFRILYNNPFYSLPRYLKDRLTGEGPRHRVGLRAVAPNLWTATFFPCFPNRVFAPALTRKFNLWLAARQLRRAIRVLDFKDYVLWIESLPAAPLADEVQPRAVCYDCFDNEPAFYRGSRKRELEATENRLLRNSDLVIASSEELQAKCRRVNPSVYLVRNGVQIRDYADDRTPLPPELENIRRPILGFLGLLGPWIDVELLGALALHYPQSSIVIVGPVRASVGKLSRLRNVYFGGMKAHSEVPGYIRGFDVCLIPFRQNEVTSAVNPIKFYEYCAAGKPIVSVAIPELIPHQRLCYLAHSQEEFLQAVEAALREGENPERAAELVHARQELAQQSSWEARGKEIEAILLKRLGCGRSNSSGRQSQQFR
jgi:glycosyltransferase involved in cell wall biosynthesis